ncbi:DKNYY domain-containing protein [Achromobacter xylosoxidans]
MVGVVPVQALESGTAMQGWRSFGSDGEPLLRCGDTVWTVACMDYPDGGNAPDEANYPLGGNTPANVARVLEGIASQDGIPTWEKAYDYEYLRPTRVLGKSFAHVQDSLFEDGESVYVQAAQGLLRLEGALPGMTTDLGALSLNNGRVFHRGQAIRRQPDAATLRHIGHDLYADDRRVYLLRHEMDGIHSHPDLRILQDADPARFRIRHVLPHAILSDDEQRVWLNGEPLHGVTPRAIKLMGVFFWTDGVHVYHCEKRIAQADPARFDVLADSDYARQDDAVYFRDQRIPGADAASFVADDMSTAHDRRRRYLFEEPVMSQDDAADS